MKDASLTEPDVPNKLGGNHRYVAAHNASGWILRPQPNFNRFGKHPNVES